jgi:hypothetical protein
MHSVEKTQKGKVGTYFFPVKKNKKKDSGGFYDCVNFFGNPKKQNRQYTNVFVWCHCFQPQIVTRHSIS